MKFEWNDSQACAEVNKTNSSDKQPYRMVYRTMLDEIYKDIESNLIKQDVAPQVPIMSESLINECLRTKFLKFSSQIYKWNDFP
jgi:hypothetical protein